MDDWEKQMLILLAIAALITGFMVYVWVMAHMIIYAD